MVEFFIGFLQKAEDSKRWISIFTKLNGGCEAWEGKPEIVDTWLMWLRFHAVPLKPYPARQLRTMSLHNLSTEPVRSILGSSAIFSLLYYKLTPVMPAADKIIAL